MCIFQIDKMKKTKDFIDLVSIDTEDSIQAKKDIERIDYLFENFRQHSLKTFWKDAKKFNDTITNKQQQQLFKKTNNGGRGHVNIFKRFGILFLRAWRQNIRDQKNNFIQLIASVGQVSIYV